MTRYLLLLCIAFGATACQQQTTASQEESKTVEDNQLLGELAKRTELTFPADAKVIFFSEGDSGIDGLIQAKIAVSPAEWKETLDKSKLAKEPFTDQKRYQLGPNLGKWDPEQPTSLPTAQLELPNAKALYIGVDQSDPEQTVIYLVWHTT